MELINTLKSFMSSFYPNLNYDVNEYNGKYYVTITNKLIYSEGFYNREYFLENNEKFDINSSVYDLILSFIPSISDKIFFSYINPFTYDIVSISKPITISTYGSIGVFNGEVTNVTNVPVFN